MNIPKRIEKLLNKRQQLAENLMSVNCEIDAWLESKGADLNDPDISDAVLSGCMIYTEPSTATDMVKTFIENKM